MPKVPVFPFYISRFQEIQASSCRRRSRRTTVCCQLGFAADGTSKQQNSMESFQQYVNEFRDLAKRPRSFLTQVLNLGCIVFSALMLWKGLMVVSGSESPVVVVLSGSMEPGLQRGDILFLTLFSEPFKPGDVVVFQIEGRDIPIVHRMLNVHETADGKLAMLTKGDNNQVDDRGLYAARQLFLSKKEIMGRAQAYLPYVGMVTIWLNDYPWLKYVLIGSMGFFVIIGRE